MDKLFPVRVRFHTVMPEGEMYGLLNEDVNPAGSPEAIPMLAPSELAGPLAPRIGVAVSESVTLLVDAIATVASDEDSVIDGR